MQLALNHDFFMSHSDTSEQPDSSLPDHDVGHASEQPDPDPSSQVTGPIYSEITDEESKDPTYASVGVATGKYTYNITTNTSYDTVMLQNMNSNACYGMATWGSAQEQS